MGTDELAELISAADDFDSAAQRALTALPSQMTEAATRLDEARLAFRKVLMSFALNTVKTASLSPEKD